MSNTKITSAEVAKLAGVSQSAVSRVFTPGASASKSTIERVKKAASDLGYRPNVLARAMVSGKSRMIGIVVAYLDNQFYPQALEKLSNALQSRGYHALIFMAGKNMQSIERVIEEILDYQVDGISGGTFTSVGVEEMMSRTLLVYHRFIKNQKRF